MICTRPEIVVSGSAFRPINPFGVPAARRRGLRPGTVGLLRAEVEPRVAPRPAGRPRARRGGEHIGVAGIRGTPLRGATQSTRDASPVEYGGAFTAGCGWSAPRPAPPAWYNPVEQPVSARVQLLSDQAAYRVRLRSAGHREEVAAALGRCARLRGGRSAGAPEVLLPRHVRLSVGARARRTRPQLHDRGRHCPHEADAGVQRPASVRLGRLRSSRRERRHQEPVAPPRPGPSTTSPI